MRTVDQVYPPKDRQSLAADGLVKLLRERAKQAQGLIVNKQMDTLDSGYSAVLQVLLMQVCRPERNLKGVIRYLFGTKDGFGGLTQGQWAALYCWVFPHTLSECPSWCPDRADTWHKHPALQAEFDCLYDAVQAQITNDTGELSKILMGL